MADDRTSARDDLSLVSIVVSLVAVLGMIVAVGFGMRAVDESKKNREVALGAAASEATVTVTLKEFTITPNVIEAGPATKLLVENKGTMQHDLVIEGQNLKTALINANASAELDVSGLKEGTYTVFCDVPGHREAGMVATLHVGATGASGQAGQAAAHATSQLTPDQMDQAMRDRTLAFPAKTEGAGGLPLAPKVLADGTKEFDLTADIVQWEVEPGKKVEAWAYNGVVPGPTISVNNGDKVKIVLKNNLKESTTMHFHGLDVPNDQDGVPDITQPQIKPGATYTYQFTAHGPAVGMYHAHSDSQVQVPFGLAGAFLIDHMPTPAGRTPTQEKIMVLNDAGNIGFAINGKSFPATEPIQAKVGETILVHYFNEGFQIHPMHLHGPLQTVIAKDGVPLAQPYTGDTILIAPGERYTVLVTPTRPGTWVWHCHILTHAEAPNGFIGMTTALIVK